MRSALALALLMAGCATGDGGHRPVDRADAGRLPDATPSFDGGADAEPKGDLVPVINEFVADDPGEDGCEYVEVFGTPGVDYGRYTVLAVEGDGGNDPGTVQAVIPVGTTAASGLWVSPLLAGELENGTSTLLLVADHTGDPVDVDMDDDGTIDGEPWGSLADAVAVHDGGAADLTYAGDALLVRSFDGGTSTVAGASRIPDGTDTGAPTDWVRNLDNAAGIPACESGVADAGQAQNTPGEPNRI